MIIDAKKDGEYTRLEIYLDTKTQGADYIAIVRGEGKEDIYFTNTTGPFTGTYAERPGKYIRVEADRLVLYSKIESGNIDLLEKHKGQKDKTSTGRFSASPQKTI
jgi:hypothetical protein